MNEQAHVQSESAASTTNEQPPDESTDRSVETGADAVIAALENGGVEHVFGVQGGAIMPVFDSLGESHQLSHVTMAHEQGAAHAADAYGIVADEPGVCMVTSGPGATNLITGLADADMDSDPVVALTGQVPTDFVGNDAFQETDTTGITDPITKHNIFASDPDTVGENVGTATALAVEGRPGPTLVDLPKDVTMGPTQEAPDDPSTPATYEYRTEPDQARVTQAARAIEAADKPLLLAGGGVIKANASDELRSFATTHGIPVVTTMPGLGSFPEDHELSLEMGGMHGPGYANMAISHCDLLIGVGTRFEDRLTGDIETFAPNAAVVHVDIDPTEISKNVEADYPVVGDAAHALRALDRTMETSPDTTAWQQQVTEWKDNFPMGYPTPDDRPLQPEFIVEAVDEATPDDTIVTTGVGQHQMWACQYWTFREPRTWVSSHGLGTMGYGLPAAIGARLAADPEQTVVSFDGDGSFLMTIQELSVAVRENLDITFVVLNNEYIGMVRQWQDAFYDGRRTASDYHWVPDFADLAEAFGARGFTVDNYDDAPDQIQTALASDEPAVLDVHIDPEANVYPMVPSGGNNAEFALEQDQL